MEVPIFVIRQKISGLRPANETRFSRGGRYYIGQRDCSIHVSWSPCNFSCRSRLARVFDSQPFQSSSRDGIATASVVYVLRTYNSTLRPENENSAWMGNGQASSLQSEQSLESARMQGAFLVKTTHLVRLRY